MRTPIPSNYWIEEKVSKTFIPPILYTVPPEGWQEWVAKLTDEDVSGADTISGRMDENTGLNLAQWLGLKAALLGYIEGPDKASLGRLVAGQGKDNLVHRVIAWDKADEARMTRQAFENGFALPVSWLNSIERFTSCVPVVRIQSRGIYTAGEGKQQHTFAAGNHSDALGLAANWFSEWGDTKDETGVRGTEIAARRELAEKTAANLPPIYVDLADLQLEYDQELWNERSEICAWLNGSHGYYIIVSDRWCYALKISNGPAAKLAIQSVVEDETRLFLQPEDMPVFAGLEDWESDGDGGFTWKYGQVMGVKAPAPKPPQPATQAAPSFGAVETAQQVLGWKLVFSGKPLAILHVNNRTVRATGAKNKELLSSPIPPSWGEDVEPPLAWATWRLICKATGKRTKAKKAKG